MSLRIYGNRLIKTLAGQDTRPTPARVREALFNIWQGKIAGCRWLDLCAGSGAMGAEALCRGASLVIGIEQSPRACAVIQANWERVATADQRFHVLRGAVVKQLKPLVGRSFALIYFDPPYASQLYQPVLTAIDHYHLLTPTAELAVEHRRQPRRPDQLVNHSDWQCPPALQLCRQKNYGGTALSFYQLNLESSNPQPEPGD